MTLQDSMPAKTHPGKTRPGKRLVICLDGTNNQIGVSRATNVATLFQMLSVTDPEKQLVYYDPGVGTLPAATARGELERKASVVAQLAFGWGIRTNVIQAYTWLMQHYQRGDRIYVFGFSRGAYTARALIGMLNRPGLLRPGSENLVPYAVREYALTKRPDAKRKKGIQDFADALCWGTEGDPMTTTWPDEVVGDECLHWGRHAVPITYAGLWDTVEATGLGRLGRLNWPFTHKLLNVEHIRHAVSIDENRRPYHEFLVDQSESVPGRVVEEAWFSGVHSDIGGTFEAFQLAKIALKWVVDGVIEQLILREPTSYSDACSVQQDFAGIPVNAMSWWWALAGRRRRPIPNGANVHESVRYRLSAGVPCPNVRGDDVSFVGGADWYENSPGSLTAAPQRATATATGDRSRR